MGYQKRSGPLDVRLILAIVLLAGALGCSLTRPTTEGTLGDSHRDLSGGTLPATPARAPTPEPPPEVASHPRHGHPNGQSFPRTLAALGEDVVEDAVYLLTSPLRIDEESALVLGGVAVGIGVLMVFDDDIADLGRWTVSLVLGPERAAFGPPSFQEDSFAHHRIGSCQIPHDTLVGVKKE